MKASTGYTQTRTMLIWSVRMSPRSLAVALIDMGRSPHDQAAHDFHRGRDAVHLRVPDGRLPRLVISLSLLAASIDLRANPVRFLDYCRKLLVNLFPFRLLLFCQGRQRGRQFFALLSDSSRLLLERRSNPSRKRRHRRLPGRPFATLVIDGEQFRLFDFDLVVDFRDQGWFKIVLDSRSGGTPGLTGSFITGA